MNRKIIQYNQKIYNLFRARIEQDDLSWYSAVCHFRCVQCGRYTTRMNFTFFDKNYKQVLCYRCQQK